VEPIFRSPRRCCSIAFVWSLSCCVALLGFSIEKERRSRRLNTMDAIHNGTLSESLATILDGTTTRCRDAFRDGWPCDDHLGQHGFFYTGINLMRKKLYNRGIALTADNVVHCPTAFMLRTRTMTGTCCCCYHTPRGGEIQVVLLGFLFCTYSGKPGKRSLRRKQR